jgi:hypothetical protein
MTSDQPEAGRVAFVEAPPTVSWHQRKADTAAREPYIPGTELRQALIRQAARFP